MYYITSNESKLRLAERYLTPYGISVEGASPALTEIQSDNIEEVAADKARQAFAVLQKPLFVNDVGWHIPALGGFPGPYMKYINQWLTAEDLIKLMEQHENREVIFREVICYIDKNHQKTFTGEVKGTVLHVNTAPDEIPSRSVFSLSETGKSIAECWKQGMPSIENYRIWEELAAWYMNQNAKITEKVTEAI